MELQSHLPSITSTIALAEIAAANSAITGQEQNMFTDLLHKLYSGAAGGENSTVSMDTSTVGQAASDPSSPSSMSNQALPTRRIPGAAPAQTTVAPTTVNPSQENTTSPAHTTFINGPSGNHYEYPGSAKVLLQQQQHYQQQVQQQQQQHYHAQLQMQHNAALQQQMQDQQYAAYCQQQELAHTYAQVESHYHSWHQPQSSAGAPEQGLTAQAATVHAVDYASQLAQAGLGTDCDDTQPAVDPQATKAKVQTKFSHAKAAKPFRRSTQPTTASIPLVAVQDPYTAAGPTCFREVVNFWTKMAGQEDHGAAHPPSPTAPVTPFSTVEPQGMSSPQMAYQQAPDGGHSVPQGEASPGMNPTSFSASVSAMDAMVAPTNGADSEDATSTVSSMEMIPVVDEANNHIMPAVNSRASQITRPDLM